jgi:hypothetical protein
LVDEFTLALLVEVELLVFDHFAQEVDQFVLDYDAVVYLNQLQNLHYHLVILLPAFLAFFQQQYILVKCVIDINRANIIRRDLILHSIKPRRQVIPLYHILLDHLQQKLLKVCGL